MHTRRISNMFFIDHPKYENRSFCSKILCSRRAKQKKQEQLPEGKKEGST